MGFSAINTVDNKLSNYALTSNLTDGSVTKVGTSTVGASNKPIYLNAGVPTASNSSLGSATQPIYISSGALTAGTALAAGAYKAMGSVGPGNTGLVTGGDVYTAISAKQNAISTATISVPTTGGAVTVTGMTTTALVWVSPAPTSFSVYTTAGCYCSAQAANSLTFTVTKTATEAMSVNVAWCEP